MAHKFVVLADQQPPRAGTKVLTLVDGVITWEDSAGGGGGSLPLSATVYGTGTAGTAGSPCPTDEFLQFDSGLTGTTTLPTGVADGTRVGFINVDHTDVAWTLDPDGDLIDTTISGFPPASTPRTLRLGSGGFFILLRAQGKWVIEDASNPMAIVMGLIGAGAISWPTWIGGSGDLSPTILFTTSNTALLVKGAAGLEVEALNTYTVPARSGTADGVTDVPVPVNGLLLRQGSADILGYAISDNAVVGNPAGSGLGNIILNNFEVLGRNSRDGSGDLRGLSSAMQRNTVFASGVVDATADETPNPNPDWLPTKVVSSTKGSWYFRVQGTATAAYIIQGMFAWPTDAEFSPFRYIVNDSDKDFTYAHDSASAADPTYQILCPDGTNYVHKVGTTVLFIYDYTVNRWRLIPLVEGAAAAGADITGSDTTANDTPVTLATYATTDDDSVVFVEGKVLAINSTDDERWTFRFHAEIHRDGASALTVDGPHISTANTKGDTNWGFDLVVSSQDVLFQFTGDDTNPTKVTLEANVDVLVA